MPQTFSLKKFQNLLIQSKAVSSEAMATFESPKTPLEKLLSKLGGFLKSTAEKGIEIGLERPAKGFAQLAPPKFIERLEQITGAEPRITEALGGRKKREALEKSERARISQIPTRLQASTKKLDTLKTLAARFSKGYTEKAPVSRDPLIQQTLETLSPTALEVPGALRAGLRQGLPKLKSLVEAGKQIPSLKPGIEALQKTAGFAKVPSRLMQAPIKPSTLNIEKFGWDKEIQDLVRAQTAKGVPKISVTFEALNRAVEKGKVTKEAVINAGDELAKDPLNFSVPDTFKAQARGLLKEEQNKLFDLGRKASVEGAEPKIIEEFNQKVAENYNLLTATQNLSSASGRALAFEKSIPLTTSERFRKEIEKGLKSMPKEQAQELYKKMLLAGEDLDKLKKTFEDTVKITFWDKLIEGIQAGWMSGVGTPQRVAIGTVTNFLSRIARSPIEALIDIPISRFAGRERQAFFGEVPRAITGIARGIIPSIKGLGRDIKKIVTLKPVEGTRRELKNIGKIKGMKGEIIRTPFKVVATIDNAISEIVRASEKSRFEYKITHGAKIKNVERAINDELENILLTGELGKVGEATMKLINSNPVTRLLFPFFRTFLHASKNSIQHVPGIGLLLAGKIKDPRFVTNVAKNILGTAISIPIFLKAIQKNEDGRPSFIGAIPENLKERKNFEAQNKIPHSVRIGNNYYSHQPLDAVTTLIDTIATAADKYNKTEDWQETLWSATKQAGRSIIDKPFAFQLEKIYRALTFEDPAPMQGLFEKLTDTAGEYGASFVPTFYKKLIDSLDLPVRIAETGKEKFQALIPGLRQKLPQKVDILGRPIERPSMAGTLLSPIQYRKGEITDIQKEFNRLGKDLPIAPLTVAGFKLSKQQHNRLQKITGEQVDTIFNKVLNSDFYNQLNDNQRAEIFDKLGTAISKASSLVFQVIDEKFKEEILQNNKNATKYYKEVLPLVDPEFYAVMTEEQLEGYIRKHFDYFRKNKDLQNPQLLQSIILKSLLQ